MLPGSGKERISRRSISGGRTKEIQRLIGRSLRAAVDLAAMREVTAGSTATCFQADGGTRTASITGSVGSPSPTPSMSWLLPAGSPASPIIDHVRRSVGILDDQVLLDLDYPEDVCRRCRLQRGHDGQRGTDRGPGNRRRSPLLSRASSTACSTSPARVSLSWLASRPRLAPRDSGSTGGGLAEPGQDPRGRGGVGGLATADRDRTGLPVAREWKRPKDTLGRQRRCSRPARSPRTTGLAAVADDTGLEVAGPRRCSRRVHCRGMPAPMPPTPTTSPSSRRCRDGVDERAVSAPWSRSCPPTGPRQPPKAFFMAASPPGGGGVSASATIGFRGRRIRTRHPGRNRRGRKEPHRHAPAPCKPWPRSSRNPTAPFSSGDFPNCVRLAFPPPEGEVARRVRRGRARSFLTTRRSTGAPPSRLRRTPPSGGRENRRKPSPTNRDT